MNFHEKICEILEAESENILFFSFPATKTITRSEDVSDLNPYQLQDFLFANCIPTDCHFSVENYSLAVEWREDVVVSETEINKEKEVLFHRQALLAISAAFKDYGYSRKTHSIDELKKKIKNKPNTYRSFLKGEIDLVVNYFLSFFKKEEL